ncbi:MAG: YkgJ family cysteine cluster protein [Nitrospirae bacterium]|nr:MAG: YkgJ family cysteine cluster protein [Nitrospirota bacterium]
MKDRDELWDDLSDDPDFLSLSDEEKERLLSLMERMLEMGIFAVYGLEDDEEEVLFNCSDYLYRCKAQCCTFHFALTKEEVKKGIIKYNKKRPFFIAREEDGYCPHLDRSTLKCKIWKDRPLRCRRYDCREDKDVWPDGFPPPD